MSKIYAGIVSYNPELKRLKENISAIQNQLLTVVVFDNGSNNIDEIQDLISDFTNVTYIRSEKNLGIAAALNRLMQWGYEKGYDWMLSLDQDSVCEKNFVAEMTPYLTVEQNLGVVAPVIVDRNVGVVGHNPKSEYAHVNTCITSGAFSKISAWKKSENMMKVCS